MSIPSTAAEAGALAPESVVTAATVEEPLPLLMAGMSIWGFAMTAVFVLPVGFLAIAASPLIICGQFSCSSR